jgi:hypothetical protein
MPYCWCEFAAMIGESSYWKNDLLKNADALRKRMKQRRWADASVARTEQAIMLGFYTVRKLMQAQTLSTSTVEECVQVRRFRASGRVVHHFNWHRLPELYDLQKGTAEARPLEFVCNQVIHSYVFMLILEEDGGLRSIMVSSDNRRSKELFEIPATTITAVFERVGRDYPNEMISVFDMQKGDYRIRQEQKPGRP